MVRKEIKARENEELEKIVELFEKAKNKKHSELEILEATYF